MFFYRLVLNGHKVKLELHFYNNILIFYSYICIRPTKQVLMILLKYVLGLSAQFVALVVLEHVPPSGIYNFKF